MGKRVSNLAIKVQAGTEDTLVATWSFDASTPQASTGGVKVGDWVTVKEGSRWYNGVGIASFVFGQEWQVVEVAGDRAVLGPNRDGSRNIQSPISVANLSGGTGGGSSAPADTLERYIYTWFYDTGDGIWYEGDSTDQGDKEHAYAVWDAPDNAIRVHFHVIPVSTTHKVNKQDTRWWSGEVSIAQWVRPEQAPEQLDAPAVEADGYALTASYADISDPLAESIQFQVYDGSALFATGTSTVKAALASYRCAVKAGGSYRVRARAGRKVGSSALWGEWSGYAGAVGTVPAAPAGITSVKGTSSTSVRVEWAAATGAETYELERAESPDLLGSSDASETVTGIEGTSYTVTGLDSGRTWWFRVRAVNAQGGSAWTEAKSVVIGTRPSAPTTWSSTTSAVVGEPVTLFWVHNAEDGSDQSYAQVELTVGGKPTTTTLQSQTELELDTSAWEEGGTVSWRARTAGATKEYGPWSEARAIDVYAPPTLTLSLLGADGQAASPLTSFPLRVKALAGPATQEPVGYSVSIRALDAYTALDQAGTSFTVAAGDEVLARYVDTKDALDLSLSASDVDLQGGASYEVEVTASMDSGLSATATARLEVSWADQAWPLDCEIALDPRSLACYVTPYSRDPETGEPNAGLDLAVYRRGHDGALTEVASGLDSARNTVVTDPHPSLDWARYRIVAVDRSTGAVSWYDAPGYPVGCLDAVIQWDEEWQDFDRGEEGAPRMEPAWSGSMLRLPYDIEVQDSTEPDAELVRYIGRAYPVAYQGTQVDATSSWSVSVLKGDSETIMALRRLAAWHGDAYVREPSGSGYWAHLAVSIGVGASSGLVPVKLDVTRVEGGA